MLEQRPLAPRILRIFGFGFLALAITALAGGIWGALLVANLRTGPAVPWAVAVMAPLLWLMWNYLAEKGWPRSTSDVRRRYLRANPGPLATYVWSFAAGGLAVVALAGYWIVFSQLVKMPPNVIPGLTGYPPLTLGLVVLMASLIAPFIEEAAFRGYFQVVLERDFRAPLAVVITSIFFAVAHLNHGIVWPKILVYFPVGVTFGATAYLTNSYLPAIPPHMFGDLVFFLFVWPHDAARKQVWDSGPDSWFWIHVAQSVVFTVFALWAFMQLAKRPRLSGT